MRALRALPPPPLRPGEEARVRVRATAAFVDAAARHRRLVRRAARTARPLLPLSLAGFAVAYLVWAVEEAARFLR